MPLTRIELTDEFLHHLPRHPFDWPSGVTFEMTGIGAHDFLPLRLCDFILAEIKRLADDDQMDRLLVRVTFLCPHHELASGNAHKLHTNAVVPRF